MICWTNPPRKRMFFWGYQMRSQFCNPKFFEAESDVVVKTTAIVRFPTKKHIGLFFRAPEKRCKDEKPDTLLVISLFLHSTRGICCIHSDAFATNPRNLWFERSPSRNGGRQTVPLAFQRTRGLQVNSGGDDESWILHFFSCLPQNWGRWTQFWRAYFSDGWPKTTS